MDKLTMTEGQQESAVKAVNLQLKSSPEVYQNFTVLLTKPHAFGELRVFGNIKLFTYGHYD